MNEFFFAEKGKGATLNDKPIQVSSETEALKACLVTGFLILILICPMDRLKFLNVLYVKVFLFAGWFCCY